MNAKIHVHLHASDLEASRRFYEAAFGPPVKLKPGYAKFLPGFAPLNLAISQGAPHPPSAGGVTHYGIQLDSPALVREHLTRVKAAGLPVREEMGVNCCHANQDKFWVRDPDGNQWEFYHLNYDLEPQAESTAPVSSGAPAAPKSCCAL